MGQSYLVECKNCNYKTELMTGFNRIESDSINVAISNINYRKRKIIKHILKEHQNVEFRLYSNAEYSWKIFHCNKCDNLFSRFWLKLFLDDKELYKTNYICPACRSKDISIIHDDSSIEKEIKNFNCPKCKESSLIATLGIIYD